eukprot:CAMPEP_0170321790 /NCGR_PEP_ID=MMETSP0116_2-20130129/61664_1 /TAXON_ID=400756 /ORGANISM="Durinskia baltica, Strain CSIRO CS-38" /LENGTH=71 /DNA_ID=CAMNT_0010574631 /DNA_START=58 /DNA_END=270 /DNA_ORIENTATION=-
MTTNKTMLVFYVRNVKKIVSTKKLNRFIRIQGHIPIIRGDPVKQHPLQVLQWIQTTLHNPTILPSQYCGIV